MREITIDGRRALIWDKVGKLDGQTQEIVSGKMPDLRSRAKGMLHEGKSAFGSDEKTATEQPNLARRLENESI